jgi:hypothetical protein
MRRRPASLLQAHRCVDENDMKLPSLFSKSGAALPKTTSVSALQNRWAIAARYRSCTVGLTVMQHLGFILFHTVVIVGLVSFVVFDLAFLVDIIQHYPYDRRILIVLGFSAICLLAQLFWLRNVYKIYSLKYPFKKAIVALIPLTISSAIFTIGAFIQLSDQLSYSNHNDIQYSDHERYAS